MCWCATWPQVSTGTMPGQYDRNTMQRYLSLDGQRGRRRFGPCRQANSAKPSRRPASRPKACGWKFAAKFRRCTKCSDSMAIGLVIAVVTIMVMLTAYFESPRLALAAVSAVPGVLSGVVLLLFITHTTLNIESFMGSIMCIGVSLSNSVMMVAFIARDWRHGKIRSTPLGPERRNGFGRS